MASPPEAPRRANLQLDILMCLSAFHYTKDRLHLEQALILVEKARGDRDQDNSRSALMALLFTRPGDVAEDEATEIANMMMEHEIVDPEAASDTTIARIMALARGLELETAVGIPSVEPAQRLAVLTAFCESWEEVAAEAASSQLSAGEARHSNILAALYGDWDDEMSEHDDDEAAAARDDSLLKAVSAARAHARLMSRAVLLGTPDLVPAPAPDLATAHGTNIAILRQLKRDLENIVGHMDTAIAYRHEDVRGGVIMEYDLPKLLREIGDTEDRTTFALRLGNIVDCATVHAMAPVVEARGAVRALADAFDRVLCIADGEGFDSDDE